MSVKGRKNVPPVKLEELAHYFSYKLEQFKQKGIQCLVDFYISIYLSCSTLSCFSSSTFLTISLPELAELDTFNKSTAVFYGLYSYRP